MSLISKSARVLANHNFSPQLFESQLARILVSY